MISVKSALHKRLKRYTGPSYRAPINRKLFKVIADGPCGKPGTYAGQFISQDSVYIFLYTFNYCLFLSNSRMKIGSQNRKNENKSMRQEVLDCVTLQAQQLLASLSASLCGWESQISSHIHQPRASASECLRSSVHLR